MRMAASWFGPHEAHRIQARGAMTRARWRTPLGLARNRLSAQQTRRNAATAPEPEHRCPHTSRCSDWTRRPGASPLMRMAASWFGPHEAYRIQARGAMTRARWRTPLGLARNRLSAQQTRRNAATELEP